MVNAAVTFSSAGEAERALALSYAPTAQRQALRTLFALDARLRTIARAARDPTIGLMRLTWWADALEKLDDAMPPAEPLLQAVAADLLPHGVTGAALAGLVEGWAQLLEPDGTVELFTAERGGRLFGLAATLLDGADTRVEAVGKGWALVELAQGWPEWAGAARVMGRDRLAGAFDRRWPTRLRSLGALGLLARADLDGRGLPGNPWRVGRLLWHRLTGM